MSADRWAICPKCKQTEEQKRDAAIKKAKAKYGKVPEEQYRQEIKKAEATIHLQSSFREDFEQGMDEDGTYSLTYNGECSKCGFTHTYEFSQNVLTPK